MGRYLVGVDSSRFDDVAQALSEVDFKIESRFVESAVLVGTVTSDEVLEAVRNVSGVGRIEMEMTILRS